jgi:hypothetical protein
LHAPPTDERSYIVTAVSARRSTADAEARHAYEAFDRTLHGALGNEISNEVAALRENAVAAYAAALGEPVSRAAWTAFVQAVSDFLEELDSGIGIPVDRATGKSRRELRDIVSENDDLLVPPADYGALRRVRQWRCGVRVAGD